MVQLPQAHNHGNMTTMGEVDTSDFDDDKKMSYKYILSIT